MWFNPSKSAHTDISGLANKSVTRCASFWLRFVNLRRTSSWVHVEMPKIIKIIHKVGFVLFGMASANVGGNKSAYERRFLSTPTGCAVGQKVNSSAVSASFAVFWAMTLISQPSQVATICSWR